MKPLTKKIMIISSSLMAAGLLLTGAGLAAGGGPGIALTPSGVQSTSDSAEPFRLDKTKLDSFTKAELRIGSEADIVILPSEDENFYLEYTLDGNYKEPDWDVREGTFTFSQEGRSSGGIFFFGSDTSSRITWPEIRLYLPEGTQLSFLDIYNDYGDLEMDGVSADSFSVYMDYGDVELSECSFSKADIELDAGDLDASSSSIDNLALTNNYGYSSLTDMKVVSADLTIDSGDLYFDAEGLETLTGTNDYGDSEIVLHDEPDTYSFDLTTDYGEIQLPSDIEGRMDSDYMEMHFVQNAEGKKAVEFTADYGNIKIQKG